MTKQTTTTKSKWHKLTPTGSQYSLYAYGDTGWRVQAVPGDYAQFRGSDSDTRQNVPNEWAAFKYDPTREGSEDQIIYDTLREAKESIER